jgi:hypothetical protein
VTPIQETRGFPEGFQAIASRRIAVPRSGIGYPQGLSLGVEVVRQQLARRAFIGRTGALQETSIF